MSDITGGHGQHRRVIGPGVLDLDHDPAVLVHVDRSSDLLVAAGQIDSHALPDRAAPLPVPVGEGVGVPVRVAPRVDLGGHPPQNRPNQRVAVENRGPSSANDVAVGTGNSSTVIVTFTPSPMTTVGDGPCAATSARMPETFLPPMRTSLGHFSRASTSPTVRNASTRAIPVMSDTQPSTAGSIPGNFSSIDTRICDRGAPENGRACLPRPLSWCSAINAVRSA